MPTGWLQIIPGVGAHTQHYTTGRCVKALFEAGLVEYVAEYGPDARVFRPTRTYWCADTDTIDQWITHWTETLDLPHDLQVLAITMRVQRDMSREGD